MTKLTNITILCVAWAISAPIPALAQSATIAESIQALPWVTAPAVGHIDQVASINLGSDLAFLSGDGADKFIQLNGNPPSPGLSVLYDTKRSWFAVFSFEGSGFVTDEDMLDADAMLATLKDNNKTQNAERSKLNLDTMTLVGWSVPPHYDTASHRLEWGTQFKTADSEDVINYTTRLLGRTGVMSATLVTGPTTFQSDMSSFRTALERFSYDPGKTYAEYQQGDKLAGYGLSALVVGAGAAAAVKFGGGFFKAIIPIGIAVIGAVGAFFRGLFRRKNK
jgi:uncharacterized membrane-anchored protein